MGERERILLVDDSSIFREPMSRILKDAGHDVVGEASSVENLIALLKDPTVEFKVAIVDGKMPNEGDGEKAANYIKSLRPQATIFALSGEERTFGQKNFKKGDSMAPLLQAIKEL